jgi:C4-dicarboxylate-specific signal transduction histidine kinase
VGRKNVGEKPIKVLLIEDSVFATRHTQKMLAEANSSEFNAELECADQLSVGLKRLAEDHIDIVLLDLTLPDSHDLDTFTAVHAQAPEMPIVVLTGLEDEKLAVEAVGKGAQDYLVKGQLDSNLLKRSMLYAIERKQVQEELRKSREHLGELVEERTAELTKTNEQLRKEIAERKQAEKALRRTYEDLEIAHRQLEESQAQLIQTEKMSALGTLVAGTAHELNNPIMGILNFAAHCKKHTSEEDQLYTVLQDIERETKRCAEIVQNLLTFSHTEQDDDKAYQKESLAEILGRVLKLLSYRIEKQGISVTQHIADDTPKIWMKPNSIQQLILNLTANALDALEGSEKKGFNVDMHREGQFVQMTFADTGCGIAAESLRSIFDPFFTTKPVGQGTGLGLSVSQGVVKTHGGQISCESEPGAGTKFTILLPIEKPEVSKRNV